MGDACNGEERKSGVGYRGALPDQLTAVQTGRVSSRGPEAGGDLSGGGGRWRGEGGAEEGGG
jgi:hypothetical protein